MVKDLSFIIPFEHLQRLASAACSEDARLLPVLLGWSENHIGTWGGCSHHGLQRMGFSVDLSLPGWEQRDEGWDGGTTFNPGKGKGWLWYLLFLFYSILFGDGWALTMLLDGGGACAANMKNL